MPNLSKAPIILEKALAEWRKQETLKKGKTSISKFAEYLGYSQQAVGFWLNRDRNISEEALFTILPKLESLLGIEVYDELEIERPDKLLEFIKGNWNKTPQEEKTKIAKIIEKYSKASTKNETEPNPKPAPKY